MARFWEFLRRRLCAAAPQFFALIAAAVCLFAVPWCLSLVMRVVTLTVSDGAQRTLYLPTASVPYALRVAGVSTIAQDDITFTETGNGTAALHVERAFPVQVTADGKTLTHMTVPCTVSEALSRMGIAVNEHDYAEPSLAARVTADTESITLHRVEYREYELDDILPYETQTHYTSLFYRSKDRVMMIQEGKNGIFRGILRDKLIDGEVVETVPVKTLEHTPATPEIVKKYKDGAPVSDLEGPAGITIENGAPSSYSAMYEMKATGYYSARGKGSSGLGLYYGTFAVDPTLIPYGTKVYITSQNGKFVYGWAIATDTGAFIHSNRMQVDLFYETYAESAINGVQQMYVYVP